MARLPATLVPQLSTVATPSILMQLCSFVVQFAPPAPLNGVHTTIPHIPFPDLQVPIYSIHSWCALRFHRSAVYLNLIRDTYESYVVYQFFSLLVAYMGGDEECVVLLRCVFPGRVPVCARGVELPCATVAVLPGEKGAWLGSCDPWTSETERGLPCGVLPRACDGVPAAMHIRDQGKRVHHVAVVLRPPSERTPRQTRSRVTIVTTGTRT